ncbi:MULTISPECIES: hypothetical protein [Heyndrickxia]|uniref:hypothetical protein n=1 Tax=Heyndrickxia TaxID=2837504 RepID=UPI000F8774F2|nr:hypothetical protein [Heyndrickxia shackletonii]MBB2480128.1 hypothetical protein [Bacillus sp. APMAM]NEY99617.1 hypothetical protein [Heyndrickxia shackletonii]RTZ56496.1 hypothetical protein EKO25_07635 [Bacillus sp. SAJ1]
MNSLIFLLLILSILLFIISFFQKDRTSSVEKEVEELSLNLYQETYQLKKRMKVLEEELLMDGNGSQNQSFSPPRNEINAILKNQVIALHKQGLNVEQISKQSALPITDVQKIILQLS